MAAHEPQLLGRRGECAALDELVASVRAGPSRALVLRGEAGVGKSALLEYLVRRASGCEIARAAGVVATGGGLGIMEAGNLGAYFAGRPPAELDAAIDELARRPTYPGHEAEYIETARSIVARQPGGAPSLAVATWRYEDEPISQFATHIAKLFQNSIREDGLLSIADAGVAYFEGSFGTLQEIFQDLAQNGSAVPAQQAAMVSSSTPPRTAGPAHPSSSPVPRPAAPRRRSTTSSPSPTPPTRSWRPSRPPAAASRRPDPPARPSRIPIVAEPSR